MTRKYRCYYLYFLVNHLDTEYSVSGSYYLRAADIKRAATIDHDIDNAISKSYMIPHRQAAQKWFPLPLNSKSNKWGPARMD